jgi:hypothetical protein
MIQIIRQVCKQAGCQPKDLIVEWTPAQGCRVIGTNPQGVKTYLNVLARLDHIARAIWLCAKGQEHLYPELQRQQAAIDAKVQKWLAENADPFKQDFGAQQQGHPTENIRGSTEEDWRQLTTVPAIVQAFPRHPSTDDIIDLYQRNKDLNSSDLRILLEKHSR